MERYIDANKFGDDLINDRINVKSKFDSKSIQDSFRYYACNYALMMLTLAETADVAPIVHAHKVRAHSQGGGTHWVVCSNCEKPIDWQDAYCKHCGAIMDEEVE